MMAGDLYFQMAGSTSASFLVEVDGKEVGRFTEVDGLQIELEVESYTEGGNNEYVHQFASRLTWPNLTFKAGITNDDALLSWFDASVGTMTLRSEGVERDSAAVTLLSASGQRLRSWELYDAMPVRWSGPSLASDANEVPTEELEVTHHGFRSVTF